MKNERMMCELSMRKSLQVKTQDVDEKGCVQGPMKGWESSGPRVS